jgi:hypothetical protein
VIDLMGNGCDLTSLANGVYFDITATQRPLRVAWIQKDEAWLALDRNGNGVIDDGAELWGSATPLSSGKRAGNGFVALAEFDANKDGMISAADPIYAQLRLWQDVNRDGVSEANELIPLAKTGVVGIELSYRELPWRDMHGNWFRYRAGLHSAPSASRRQNRFVYDVILSYQPQPVREP